MLTTVIPIATTIPAHTSSTCIPGSIWETPQTTAPFSTSTPRPSVSTVNGSATRMSNGKGGRLAKNHQVCGYRVVHKTIGR